MAAASAQCRRVSRGRVRLRWLTKCTVLFAAVVCLSPVEHAAGPPHVWSLSTQFAMAQLALNRAAQLNGSPLNSGTGATVLMLGRPGDVRELEDAILSQGGTLRFVDPAVGYVRAVVPMHLAASLLRHEAAHVSVLDSEALFRHTLQGFTFLRPATSRSSAQTRRETASSALDEPSSLFRLGITRQMAPVLNDALDERVRLGSVRRSLGMPLDGRGETIAIVEPGAASIDVTHPGLAVARDRDGRLVRKIRAVLTAWDPDAPDLATPRSWGVDLSEPIAAVGPTLQYAEKTVRLPGPGQYRMGFLASTSRPTLIACSAAGPSCWCDLNQDDTLDASEEMLDVNRYLAEDLEPLTASRFDDVPVFLARDTATRVWLHEIGATHATSTVSTAAANRLTGGLVDGVAPAARIVAVDGGGRVSSYIEALIIAARHPDVSVVSASVSAWTSPGTNDFLIVALDRIIESYRKPILIPAGNAGPAPETIETPSARSALMIGAFTDEGIVRPFQQVELRPFRGATYYSGRGPGADGTPKPDLLVPADRIVALPCTRTSMREDNDLRCYRVAAGTSMATPFAAGSAALILQLARDLGRPLQAEELADRLRNAAEPIPEVAAHEQGFGLLNMERLLADLPTPQPDRLSVFVDIHSDQGGRVRDPAYHRFVWNGGPHEVRFQLTIAQPATATHPTWVRASAQGLPVTFDGPDAILVPPNAKAVTLSGTVSVARPGVHSTLISLREREAGTRVGSALLTLAGAIRAEVRPRRFVGALPFYSAETHAVFVDAGTSELRVTLRVETGAAKLDVVEPSGFLTRSLHHGKPVPAYGHITAGTQTIRHAYPPAGVWHFTVANDFGARDLETAPARDARYVLDIEAARQDKAAPGDDVRTLPPLRIPPGEFVATRRFTVESKLEALRVCLREGAEATPTPHSAFLFRCATDGCRLRDESLLNRGRHCVTANGPEPGEWAIAWTLDHSVDAFTEAAATIWTRAPQPQPAGQ